MAQGETGNSKKPPPAWDSKGIGQRGVAKRHMERHRGWRGCREPGVPDSDTAVSRGSSWRCAGCQRWARSGLIQIYFQGLFSMKQSKKILHRSSGLRLFGVSILVPRGEGQGWSLGLPWS